MVHDWFAQVMDGLCLRRHISTIRSNSKSIAPAFKMWVIATAVTVVAAWCGVWQRLSYKANIALWKNMPMLQFSFAPVHFSNQIIYIVSSVMMLMIIRSMLAGRTKTEKSLWWYLGRALVLAVVAAVFFGIAVVSWQWVVKLAGRLTMAHLMTGGAVTKKMGSFIGLLASLLFFVSSLRMAVVGATFAAGCYLQGKGLGAAYTRGMVLLSKYWGYLVGPIFYTAATTYFLQIVMMAHIPVGSSMAVFVGALSYLCSPLYWVIFLTYHKRLVRGK